MDLIKVDYKKCVKCGLCASDCAMGVIDMGEGGWPQQARDLCIACGHCVALCPTAALDNVKSPLGGQIPVKNSRPLSPEEAEFFLRSRRTVRIFDDRPVPRSLIRRLLNISRYAQTAVNSQAVSYCVIDDRNLLGRISEAMIEWEEAMLPQAKEQADFIISLISRYRSRHQDVMLWRTPCLVLALADPGRIPRSSRDNAVFFLSYVSLYAQSFGLGTCWAGIFEACWKSGYAPLRELIKLPEELELAGAMMVGYAKYKYRRLVEREPLNILWHGE